LGHCNCHNCLQLLNTNQLSANIKEFSHNQQVKKQNCKQKCFPA
jgi:hypothetical protein